jgi:sugar lactone lactonase YvrE
MKRSVGMTHTVSHRADAEGSELWGRRRITRASGKSMGGDDGVTVDLLHDLHAELGEAPTWDERVQKLYFVDINKQGIYCCDADGGRLWSMETQETVGTIALTTDPNLLLACMNRWGP